MKILVKMAVRGSALCSALFGAMPAATAQIVAMYPGSTISFYANWSAANASYCPSGGGNGAFLRVVAVNGWKFRSNNLIRETTTGVGSADYRRISEYSVITVHPDSRRLRHWTQREEISSQSQPNLKIHTCQTSAMLQGDRLDDILLIDIGVLIGEKLQKGMQVGAITVSPPFYCGADWATQRKDSLDQSFKVFDCNTIGIPTPAFNVPTYQTENLSK